MLPIALALAAVACGQTTEASFESTVYDIRVQVGAAPGGGSLIDWNGVRIEVARDVHLEVPMNISISDGDGTPIVSRSSGTGYRVDGQVLKLEGGHVFLGTTDHGAVASGDTVSISAAGVQVSGPGT